MITILIVAGLIAATIGGILLYGARKEPNGQPGSRYEIHDLHLYDVAQGKAKLHRADGGTLRLQGGQYGER
jgi:hypothetical protein